MTNTSNDWKEVVNTYYDKCLSITILLTMFAFIVFPNVETQAIATTERIQEMIEIMPELLEQIIQQQEVVRPIVNIEIIDDDIGDDSDDDIDYIDTIAETTLTHWIHVAPPDTHGTTPRFVIREEEPVPIRRVMPTYPEGMRSSRLQGTVVLQVEVLIDGSVGAIEVHQSLIPGPGGFDEEAIRAMRQWQFQPARSQGQPVAVWIVQPFTFTFN